MDLFGLLYIYLVVLFGGLVVGFGLWCSRLGRDIEGLRRELRALRERPVPRIPATTGSMTTNVGTNVLGTWKFPPDDAAGSCARR